MRVLLYATLRAAAGTREAEVAAQPGETVGTVLHRLVAQYPALRDEIFDDPEGTVLKPYVAVYLDGRNILHLQGLATPVTGTEEVALFPPVAGGARA
ncbi:MAG: ubiquitin-like small modifier protein 1 [Bacillota bacterium]|nr:MAG: molybdopterin synthase sulfur carrier subunit [Bacillota bacterium]